MTTETTMYGFKYGAAEIRRYHDWKGAVFMGLLTPKAELEIYVTPGGKVRIWNKKTGKEIDLNSEVKK